jgi:hypothetical protein
MKLRNILMVVAAMGIMFASMDRTAVVGYTEGDYTDMMTFAHKAAGQNVAYTAGSNFAAVWSDGGTTWGFAGGDTDDMVNMLWSNGTYGLDVAMSMDSATAGDGTTFDLGFGMNLMGYDVGFHMDTATDGPMSLNLRGNCNFWVWDTMTFAFNSATTDATDWTSIDVGMYSVNDWGAATGYFAMGITSSDNPMYVTTWADAVTLINTSFSVESTLTDWCDLRIGYAKNFNVGPADGEAESTDSFMAGVGFNYGSVGLDMTLGTGVLNNMMSNPLEYVNGRNAEDLAASWTLSYTW